MRFAGKRPSRPIQGGCWVCASEAYGSSHNAGQKIYACQWQVEEQHRQMRLSLLSGNDYGDRFPQIDAAQVTWQGWDVGWKTARSSAGHGRISKAFAHVTDHIGTSRLLTNVQIQSTSLSSI